MTMEIRAHLACRNYPQIGLSVVYDLQYKQFHMFEGVSSDIWQHLQQGKTVEQIVERIACEYDFALDDRSIHSITNDITDFIATLELRGLLQSHQGDRNRCQTNTDHELAWVDTDLESTAYDRMADSKILYSATWEITQQCNLSCVHCYCPPVTKSMWNPGAFDSVAKQLSAMGAINIEITGGECLAHPDITHFMRSLSDYGFVIGILSNGTLINKTMAKSIASVLPRSVQISLYSNDETVHDAVTGVPGSFRRTISGIRNLVDVGVIARIACSVTTLNYRSVPALYDWCKREGLDVQFAFRIIPSWNKDRSTEQLRCSDIDYVKSLMQDERYNGLISAVRGRKHKPKWNPSKLCQAGFRNICIASNGDVYPCNTLRYKVGNVFDSSLQSIWNESKQLEHWRNISISDYDECSRCEAQWICKPCPASHYTETGRLDCVDQHTCELGWFNHMLLKGCK